MMRKTREGRKKKGIKETRKKEWEENKEKIKRKKKKGQKQLILFYIFPLGVLGKQQQK